MGDLLSGKQIAKQVLAIDLCATEFSSLFVVILAFKANRSSGASGNVLIILCSVAATLSLLVMLY